MKDRERERGKGKRRRRQQLDSEMTQTAAGYEWDLRGRGRKSGHTNHRGMLSQHHPPARAILCNTEQPFLKRSAQGRDSNNEPHRLPWRKVVNNTRGTFLKDPEH